MTWDYLYVFFQSMGLEAILIAAYCYWVRGISFKKTLSLVFMTNACTHPVVIFIIMKTGTYLSAILVAESFAWLAEGYVYHRKLLSPQWVEPFALSLVANLISWQLGPIFTAEVLKLVA